MKKRVPIFMILMLFVLQSFAQDRKVDLLEVLYKQENYRSIVRKTTRMINKKGYDDNELVHLFKAVALGKLSETTNYLRMHPDAIKKSIEAFENYYELDKQNNFEQKESILIQDLREIYKKDEGVLVKTDALSYLMKEEEKSTIVQKKQIVVIKNKVGKKVEYDNDFKAIEIDTVCNETYIDEDDKMINYASKFIGVPYVYGGTGDGGFDCSGYTQYVLGKYGYSISRSARNQFTDTDPVKMDKAQKGDLVFFSKSKSKNNITHVGIVISDEGEELTMIHASSSRGIMITNVETNSYWKPKLVGIGRPQKEDS